MKKQEYYYPLCIMSKPFEEDYTQIELGLFNYEDIVVDNVTVNKRETKNKKFSQYKVIKETFNEKAFDLDTKKYQKYIKEYNELCIKRKEEFFKDLAEENNVNIDFVVKALKCLDFVVDEFCNDGLTGHIYDHYHLKENEEIFEKRVEYINSIINIMK